MINWIQRALAERPGLYWHCFPTYNQGRKIAWEGMTRDGRKFLDHFHPQLISGHNNTDMRVSFKNGAVYQVVGSDNPDRLVGANPVGVVFSEYALQDPRAWDYIRPILVENKGWAVFIYTPRGRNHGYDLLRIADRNTRWFSQILGIDKTDIVSTEDIQHERDAGMPEEMVEQEFYCSFDAALVGAYYGEYLKNARLSGRLTNVPFDPMLDVHTAWDLGIGDQMVLIFFQLLNDEIRIIDVYSNTDRGLPHYAKIMGEGHRSEYSYGEHYAPHDIQVKDMSTGRSRLEAARDLGIRFRVVPKLPIEDGIEAVRQILSRVWFNTSTPESQRLVDALQQYKKEWDDKKRCFRDRPYHDWTSDYADALRYLALGLRRYGKSSGKTRKWHELVEFGETFGGEW